MGEFFAYLLYRTGPGKNINKNINNERGGGGAAVKASRNRDAGALPRENFPYHAL